MEMKMSGIARGGKVRIAALVLLLLGMLSNLSGADAASFCTTMTSQSVLGSNSSGFQGLLLSSVIIIVIIVSIIAILYLLATALKVDKLIRFVRAEIGEIIVTIIIVFVFLGSFYLVNGLAPSNLFAVGTVSGSINNIFYNDCYALASSGTNVLNQLSGIIISQRTIALVSTLQFNFLTTYSGIEEVTPYSGLSLVAYSLMSNLIVVASGIFGVLVIMAAIVGIFYAVFPLFFFVGILLRSFPWTRAAGGAFLGLFIGFYLMFPMLLATLLSAQNIGNPTSVGLSTVLNNFNGGAISTDALADFFSSGSITIIAATYSFITNTIGYAFYAILAAVVSFIISFDFTESVGDFLGAPSLSSSNVLKRLL